MQSSTISYYYSDRVHNRLIPEEILHAQESNHYEQLGIDKKERWLMGRYLAKQAIANTYNTSKQQCRVRDIEITTQLGIAPSFYCAKEFFQSNQSIKFSISHTAQLTVVGLIQSTQIRSLGIDVERIRTFSKNTIREFMTLKEFQKYIALPLSEQAQFATTCWTLKESYLKALGVGLRQHPRTVETTFTLDATAPAQIFDSCKKSTKVKADWTLYERNSIISTSII